MALLLLKEMILGGRDIMMNKKSFMLGIIIALGCLGLVSNAAFRMVCIPHARSGEDQKLYGHYHTSYATADDYHCYFTFDPADVVWVSLREGRKRAELQEVPYLPSYQAKVVYFINAAPYLEIIEALKKPGKTIKHLRSIPGAAEAPIFKSYKDAKITLPKLTE